MVLYTNLVHVTSQCNRNPRLRRPLSLREALLERWPCASSEVHQGLGSEPPWGQWLVVNGYEISG